MRAIGVRVQACAQARRASVLVCQDASSAHYPLAPYIDYFSKKK